MLYNITLIAGIFLIVFSVYGLEVKRWSIGRIYPLTAAILCSLYVYIIPALKAPDEVIHFYSTFYASMHWSLKDVAYTVPALLFRVGMLAGKDNSVILGTFGNVVLFVLLTSYAIRKLPFGKRTLYIICLLPITLQQAASLSYDGPVIAAVIVITSLSLRWKYLPDPVYPHKKLRLLDGSAYITNRATISEAIIFAAMCLILINTKGGAYAPICLMPVVLFINVHWFKGGRAKIFVAALIAVIILGMVWLLCGNGGATIANFFLTVPYIAERGLYAYPPIYYLIDPHLFFERIVNTFSRDGRLFIYELFGGILGSLDIFTWNPGVHALFWLFVISLIRRDDEHRYIMVARRIVILIMAAIPDIIAILAMLFYWTPIDANVIEGIQGRYFLPTLFLVSVGLGYWKKPAIHSEFIKRHEDTVLAVLTLFFTIAMSLSAITFKA